MRIANLKKRSVHDKVAWKNDHNIRNGECFFKNPEGIVLEDIGVVVAVFVYYSGGAPTPQ